MSEEPEDVKPKLNLTISYQENHITVKVRANMPFKKIFDAAETRFGKDPGTFKFTHDGQRLHPEDTPASRQMEDGDQIDAFLEQALSATKDTKPNQKIEITVFHEGKSIKFMLKRTSPLRKVMDAFANSIGKEMNSLRFSFDGLPLRGRPDETPENLGMQDQDVIDANLMMVGGHYRYHC